MSIPDAQPQAQPAARSSSLFNTVKDFLLSLGVPASNNVTQHTAHCHHEDVPTEVGSEGTIPRTPLAGPRILPETRTPSPITEAIAPGRLRSLFPPSNYGAVVPGSVYRSSYPQEKNYDFLKSLGVKTIITLVPEEISPEYRDFMRGADIQHFQVHVNANKGGVRVQSCDMNRALNIVLDRTNHPILIHCNKGKHRTGCVVATLRRLQGLDIELIREEYHTYADPKARFWDEVFFEHFDLNTVMWRARQEEWIVSSSDADAAPPSPPPSPASCSSLARVST
ncbi:hypothetical protein P280DRAFT_460947 [Massarina eburnea CBS 473.64]|uniref:Tyrosine-protein phosphatase SIW14 n=1 Tax=Massarina eburnea CBS 473.64 TaxID=1395130 RepID=A0A6A6RKZ1_9PLEO|nr:hypothetical protein P280DRAFT_460947 [Massarina eburnea CBS 473.64]